MNQQEFLDLVQHRAGVSADEADRLTRGADVSAGSRPDRVGEERVRRVEDDLAAAGAADPVAETGRDGQHDHVRAGYRLPLVLHRVRVDLRGHRGRAVGMPTPLSTREWPAA